MPNVATLGLEFNSGDASNKITILCTKLETLAKRVGSLNEALKQISGVNVTKTITSIGAAFATIKPIKTETINSIRSFASGASKLSDVDPNTGKHIQTIVSSLQNLPTVSNATVTQIAAVSNAIKGLQGIEPAIGTNVMMIANALAIMKPIPLEVVNSITALAGGINKITFNEGTTSGLASIAAMMQSMKPVAPEVAASVKQFVDDLNKVQPVKAEISQSIKDLFASASSVKISTDVNAQIKELANTLTALKVVKPEIAVSVRDIFNTFAELAAIPADVIDSITKLGDATDKFKVIKPSVATSLQKFSDILAKFPTVNEAVSNALLKMALATEKFKAIRPKVAESIKNLFFSLTTFKEIPSNISSSLNAMAQALAGFKVITKPTVNNIRELFKEIAAFKPIPESALHSIRTLTDLFRAMGTSAKSASFHTDRLSRSFSGAAGGAHTLNGALRGVTAALSVKYLKDATQKAIEFGRQLAYIKSIAMSLDTTKLEAGLMNFGSLLGNQAENAEGLYKAYSSGIRGSEEDFLRFTAIASKTAQVNRASLIPMVDAMTAAMNAYKMSVSEAGDVADTFYSIVKYGKASGEQLAQSFGQVSPTARTLGVTLDELGASIASLTKIQPTRVAITGLNNMLSKIMKPTKESRLAMEKLGVEMSYHAVQTKGFVTVLREVHDALGGNMELIKNIFPDIRGQRAAMHLLGAGWEDFNQQLDNFANKKGAMEEAFKVLENDVDVQLGAIPITINKITTEVGNMLTSILTLDGALAPVIASFNNMSAGTRKLIAGIALAVTAYAAFRTVMFAINTVRAIEIRNQAIIAAAHVKEASLAAKTAHAYAVATKMIAAKATADSVAAKAALASARATYTSIAATHAQTIADIAAAKAKGDLELVIVLQNRLIAQENALKTASAALTAAQTAATNAEAVAHARNTAALKAEAAARLASGKMSIFGALSNVASNAAGFSSGFGMMFNTGLFLKLKANWTLAGLSAAKLGTEFGKLVVVIKSLTGAVTGLIANAGMKLLAFLGSTAGIIAASIAVLAVGIDYLQSWIRTGKAWGEGSKSVTQMVLNSIVDWKTGATKTAKSIDTEVAKAMELMDTRRAIRQMGTDLQKYLSTMFDDIALREMSEPEQMKSTIDKFNETLAQMNERFNPEKVKAAFAKADEAQKTYINLRESLLEQGRKKEDDLSKDEKASLEAAKKEADSSAKAAQELNDKARELGSTLHQYADEIYRAAKDQQAALEGIKSLEKDQAFRMMKPAQQRVETTKNMQESLKAYYEAISEGNTKAAQASFKAFLGDFNSLRDEAMKKIEDNKKVMEDIKQMQLDALLMGQSTDAGKYRILQAEQQRLYNEAMKKQTEGDYKGTLDSYKKSTEAAKQMVSMYNSLAQAERSANDATQKMILSMDKFKSNAVGVVNALSTDALKLRTRQFDTMPTFKPVTTASQQADAATQQLANDMMTFGNNLNKLVEQNTKENELRKNFYENKWKEIVKGNKENLATIEDGIKEMIDNLKKGNKLEPFKIETVSF